MEIRQLKTFKTVAQLLSFNQAAKHLHYAQSSISAQIQALEEELGVKLFDRLGRGILLTEAGISLLNYAEKILDLADETRSEVAGAKELKGSLTIKVPETLGVHRLPPVIKQFRSRFPKVRLRFTTCTHEGLQKDLRKGVTDLAFLLTDSFHVADLEARALGIENLVLVAHPDHPLAKNAVVHTRDLEGETLLFSRMDCSYRKTMEALLKTEKIRYDATLDFNSVATIKQCVMTGVGISILPEITVADDILQGRMAALSWSEGVIEVACLMIWYKDRWLSPSLSTFMEVVRKILKKAYDIA
jgi:DNA-binding transcriptional LysR family regulator